MTPPPPDRPAFSHPVEPPQALSSGPFVLEPLGAEHNERDHVAWMSSLDHIRATPGFRPEDRGPGAWPQPMTLEANLEDLRQHAREFVDREAFAYSVLDHDDHVIGCVYVNPDREGRAEATCHHWVRASHADLDGELEMTLRAWLASDAWSLRSVRFPGRDDGPIQG